jgi:hypothetical protein
MIHVKQSFGSCRSFYARDSRETPHPALGCCAQLFHVKQDDMDVLPGMMVVGFDDEI